MYEYRKWEGFIVRLTDSRVAGAAAELEEVPQVVAVGHNFNLRGE